MNQVRFQTKSGSPQLPFKTPQIPSNGDHKALNRGTLGGLGNSLERILKRTVRSGSKEGQALKQFRLSGLSSFHQKAHGGDRILARPAQSNYDIRTPSREELFEPTLRRKEPHRTKLYLYSTTSSGLRPWDFKKLQVCPIHMFEPAK